VGSSVGFILPAVLLAIGIVLGAGAASAAAGYVLWRATRVGGGWALLAGPLLGLAVILAAVLLGYALALFHGQSWGKPFS
jgi:hypothetical protein